MCQNSAALIARARTVEDTLCTKWPSTKREKIVFTLRVRLMDELILTIDSGIVSVNILIKNCSSCFVERSLKVIDLSFGERSNSSWVFLPFLPGKRRYDRKQSGYGGQTKPIFHKKVRKRDISCPYDHMFNYYPTARFTCVPLVEISIQWYIMHSYSD